jgi:multicomponent Na+:H+ antiporter subunit F
MNVVAVVCGALLTAGAVLALIRAERGPSMLDRTVALDIVVTTLIGAVALEAAVARRIDTIPVLVVLSLVGFLGSVIIARFAAAEPEGEGRVRSREEVAALEAEEAARAAAEDAAADAAEGAGAEDATAEGATAEGAPAETPATGGEA